LQNYYQIKKVYSSWCWRGNINQSGGQSQAV